MEFSKPFAEMGYNGLAFMTAPTIPFTLTALRQDGAGYPPVTLTALISAKTGVTARKMLGKTIAEFLKRWGFLSKTLYFYEAGA